MNAFKNYFFLALGTLALTACGGSAVDNSPTICSTPVPYTSTPTPALATAIIAPLTGCTAVDYSVKVNVGNTPNMSLIIDSGSAALGVASQYCTTCGVTPGYVPSASMQDTCQIGTASYGDGSNWTGNIWNDTVSISTVPSVLDSIVSINSHSGFFNDFNCYMGRGAGNTNQGILGLAGYNFGVPGTVPYLDSLNAAHAFPEDYSVQMCMTGGNIWFGGFDPTYVSGSVTYTPISSYLSTPALTKNTAFYVELKAVSVGGTDMGYTEMDYGNRGGGGYGGIVVDTGTSITYLPSVVFSNIVTKLNSVAAFSSQFPAAFFSTGNCSSSTSTPAVTMTPAQLDVALPPLVLTFAAVGGGPDVLVSLPPSRSYLDMHWKTAAQTAFQYCPGIADDSGQGPDIIGGSFMRSQIVIFDRTNAQVGFASQQPLGTMTTGCTN